jgi:hypothetical protein
MATEAAATAVQVNDAQGNSLGKVKVGDTKMEALERLDRSGGLFDKNDVGLLAAECITLEGGPYVLKERQQQQKQQRGDSWYRVTGATSRPSSRARYNPFRFAAFDGLYPDDCDPNTAFQMVPSPKAMSKNVLKFSIVI